ncbi:hypothetical protein PHLCEN_2v13674 [Hermanssonia centrifuga]|uniref:Uncharacterized protein n=1 Tax=Hermanssonia centrifuga TaxID=98765 RepID=A0A2R6NDK4_9APHY|nr:hypothetical protein PHLCEN_2v13674 [Hermanssonia centrifuga]
MASEETPLLLDGPIPPVDFAAAKEHELVYNRFTPLQKRTIIALISLAGLSPLLISGSLYPSIPQIARDLDTTGSVVRCVRNAAVSSVTAMMIGLTVTTQPCGERINICECSWKSTVGNILEAL